MPKRIPWSKVKANYEHPEYGLQTIVEQAKKFNISPPTLRNKARAGGWVSPKDVAREAERKLSESAEARVDAQSDEWIARQERFRTKTYDIAMEALDAYVNRLRAGERDPKDLHELEKAVSMLKDVTGLSRKEESGLKLGLNIGLLSTPRVVDI